MLHLNIKVTGRVQGVGFRMSALRKARELEIKGFVKNQKDGSVYIEVEGKELNIIKFIEWCHHGPSGAKVHSIKTSNSQLKNFSEFTIEH
jgi:acylphosphatase